MFCTVCAATNPIASRRCAACGASFGPARAATAGNVRRGAPNVGWARRALAVVLPLALLLGGGGYWRVDQEARATAYARGEAALAAGRYVEAIDAFGAAGDYRDAAARRAAAAATLEPYLTAYEDGVAALAAGEYETAIGLLAPVAQDLPDYREAIALLSEARRRWELELLGAVQAAAERRDWLGVERALAQLVAVIPDDPALQSRLATVRRDHAPLLYSRSQAIYLIGPDGADERLVTDQVPAVWPVWSPDRSKIAFTSGDRTDAGHVPSLYVVEATGGSPRKLAEGLRPYAAPVWSPDGRWIAYTSEAPVAGRGDPGPRTVRIVEVASGREVDLTGGWLPNAASPSWSPSGDRLALVSRRDDGLTQPGFLPSGEVYVVTVATGAIADVGQGRIADPWRLAWSPTEEAIVVSTRRPGMSYDADRAPLYLLEVGTGALTNVNPQLAKVSMAVWAPDGQRFAYVEDETTIRVRRLDGGEAWTTLDGPVAGALTWSPGGDRLLAAGTPGQPSYLIPLDEEFGRERAVALSLDVDGRQAGSPQWSALNPAPPPTPPTTAGTARDPGPTVEGSALPPAQPMGVS